MDPRRTSSESIGRSGRPPRLGRSIAAYAILIIMLGAPPAGAEWAGSAVEGTPRATSPVDSRQAPTTSRKVFDAMLLRPLQLIQVAVSAIVFVPAYPVGWIFGSEDEVLEICIQEPVDRAFRRPLGEL